MKLFISINCLMFICCSYIFGKSPIVVENPIPDSTNLIYGVAFESAMTYNMIEQLTHEQIERQTGKKLKVKEKIVLAIAKRKIKKSLKKGLTETKAFEAVTKGDFVFEWRIFLWSLFLGPFAFMWYFITIKRNRRSALGSSCLGTLVWLAGIIILFTVVLK